MYSHLVIKEMRNRGYKINLDNLRNYFDCIYLPFTPKLDSCFSDKMNNRYLKQCFYNLQEKYDCGGITDEEWLPIFEEFKVRRVL